MKVLFFGTPAFAVPALRALAEAGHELIAAVTRPDRPRGRGRAVVAPSDVAREAVRLGVPVFKPERTADPALLERARLARPDVIALAAYGRLIPQALLDLPPLGPWNIHPSLLPRWRGAAPVHRAILSGDAETGVSIMRMTGRLDAGPVALQERTPIGTAETRGELEARLAAMGARLLVAALATLARGGLPAQDQDDAAAVLAPAIPPADAELHWDRTAAELDRLIRALAPAPGAYARLGELRLKLLTAAPARGSGTPGTLLARLAGGAWRVACGAGALDVSLVQPAGKAAMTMDAFVAGRRLQAGASLLPAGAAA